MGQQGDGRGGRCAPCAGLRRPAQRASVASTLVLLGLAIVMLGPAAGAALAARDAAELAPGPSMRLVSLNPSLSAILVRLDAAETLVGIDDYTARVVPELADRPQVGGLFDPNLEAVVALRPDRVLIVAGVDQEAHAQRLERLGLVVEIYANERFEEVLENIDRLGRLVGRSELAARRVGEIRAMRRAVARATRDRAQPATVAVVDRSPLFLVGGRTFLDEMLEAVGARNLVRALGDGYPRASLEWLIAARPELILDMTPGDDRAAAFWSRWPSLPAVSAERVLTLEARRLSMPGPDLDVALRELAIRVHGADVADAIDAALDAEPPRSSREAPAATPAPWPTPSAESGVVP